MAVGMATTKGLPRCPQDCGGPLGGAFPASLTKMQASQRRLWGCDKAAASPMFTITCPRCDGSRIAPDGQRCDECDQGEKRIYRCPTSHMSPDVSAAVRHYPYAEGGQFPAGGGLLDQAPSYLHFSSVLSGEVSKIRKEESDDAARKSAASASAAKVRGR